MFSNDAICRVARVGLPARPRAFSAPLVLRRLRPHYARMSTRVCGLAFQLSGESCQDMPEVGRVYQELMYDADRG